MKLTPELTFIPAPDEMQRDELFNTSASSVGVASTTAIQWLATAGAPIGAALGAWLHAHYGRKVRIKIGDIEAEATSVKEVNELLTKAQEISRENEPRRIHE